ncbi:MAG TPA: type II toxin-antitoxin system VapC family toxin, partial [Terriglobales bacterium]|nr:type II toxin-antitoxin system VapC family toxin [Terriglobales bacterium]
DGEVTRTYVLDANAVLDFVENGPGAERVEKLLAGALHGDSSVLISVVNWGEVFYHSWQERGEELARKTIGNLSRLSIETVPVDLEQSLRAGEIKARHKIPYVDCIAAALAIMRQAVLVTSDRDFEKLGRRIRVLWITRP